MPRSKLLLFVALAAAASTAPGAASGRLAVCSSAAVEPRLDTNGASGRIYVYGMLWNRTNRVCAARGRLTVRFVDAKTRRLLMIRGNPHVKRVHRQLLPGRNAIFTLEWENYCGPGRPMLFEARFGKRHDVERSSYPGARCESAFAPSRLRLFKRPR